MTCGKCGKDYTCAEEERWDWYHLVGKLTAEVAELEGINRNRQIENDKLKMEVVGLKAEKQEAVMRGMAVCVDLENLRAELELLKEDIKFRDIDCGCNARITELKDKLKEAMELLVKNNVSEMCACEEVVRCNWHKRYEVLKKNV